MDASVDAQGVKRGSCSSCKQCNEYVRPGNGHDCDYCGCKPVAHENLASPTSPSTSSTYGSIFNIFGNSSPKSSHSTHTNNTCQYPGCTKPVFVENNGKVHDYCGRTHAQLHQQQQNTNPSNNNNLLSQPSQGNSSPKSSHSQTNNTCLYPGCTKPVFVENGKPHNYCGRTHAKLHNQSSTGGSAMPPTNQVPGITFLQQTDPKYQEIEKQFISKWLHPKPVPTVRSIAIINSDSAVTNKYENYKQAIIQKRPEYATGGHKHGGPGNEHRRFHGTNSMRCTLGLNNNSTLCSDNACATCSIIRVGFQLRFKAKWGRFGEGIYLTSTSSKSDDYNNGTSTGLGSGTKAMFVCRVVVGKGKKLTQSDSTLNAAPTGYDSVLGETGGELNYDEVVVYDEDAVVPSYLIIYQH
mmetsp:Transcript_14240/g.19845  ORF Transcript_14240/g.19845 Transcript_14240/m.19845 type:complete len:409 (-) Transcript_14240:21-1247(-)